MKVVDTATGNERDVTPPTNGKTPPPLDVKNGELVPKTGTELTAMVNKIAEGGGFPERFKTPAARMAAYNLAHSLMGGKWQLALNNIASIHGQMTVFGELPGALAEQTKEVEEKEVYCIDEKFERICVEKKNLDAPPYAGVCKIKRKGRGLKEFTYTIEEARKAGQYPSMKAEWKDNKRTGKMIENPDSPWMKYTKVMLMRKAMNLAVKFEFADAMVGTPVAEYDYDEAPDLKDVTTSMGDETAARLNQAYSEEGPTVTQ
jgi:hypothetical protein